MKLNQLKNTASAVPIGLTEAAILERVCSAPLTMMEVRDAIGKSATSATDLADRLEKLGLVERELSQRDRRSVILKPTDLGRATLKTMEEAIS